MIVRDQDTIPVDPAGGCCYQGSNKPCKSDSNVGELRSNTSVICPKVRDNLGKLRIKPYKKRILECSFFQRQRLRMSRRPIRLLVR